jgi:hypothetical protein
MRCPKFGPNPNHSSSAWFSSQPISTRDILTASPPASRGPLAAAPSYTAGRPATPSPPFVSPVSPPRCRTPSSESILASSLCVFSGARTKFSPGQPMVSTTSLSPSPLGSHCLPLFGWLMQMAAQTSECWSTRTPPAAAAPGAEQQATLPSSAGLAAAPPTPPSGVSSAYRGTSSPPPRRPWTLFQPGRPPQPPPPPPSAGGWLQHRRLPPPPLRQRPATLPRLLYTFFLYTFIARRRLGHWGRCRR